MQTYARQCMNLHIHIFNLQNPKCDQKCKRWNDLYKYAQKVRETRLRSDSDSSRIWIWSQSCLSHDFISLCPVFPFICLTHSCISCYLLNKGVKYFLRGHRMKRNRIPGPKMNWTKNCASSRGKFCQSILSCCVTYCWVFHLCDPLSISL